MNKFLNIAALSLFLVSTSVHNSVAYDQNGGGGWHGGGANGGGDWHGNGGQGNYGWHGGGYWHGGDINHFHEYDMQTWHNGYWSNRFHDGRVGWWWVAGGQWYYYPAPVYPYPDPFIPPTVAAQPGVQYWFCGNPQGYYPYVAQCYVPWQPVTAQVAPPVADVAAPPQVAPVETQEPPLSGQREIDDHQLNKFVVELENIHATDADAVAHLSSLKARVAAFHQALLKRNYNAADISEDAARLEHKIAAKQDELGVDNDL